ncbi:MAG: spore germination protein [Bacilli bacterium]|nr:spore germination protein [Bacilli bacterium]
MNKILTRIKKEFQKCPDLIIKEIRIGKQDTFFIAYLESVTGSDKVNDYILKNLSKLSSETKKDLKDIQSIIPAPNTVIIKEYDQIEFYITNGFTIVICGLEVFAFETKADINRGIPEPTSEPTIVGPKDGFTENIQINLGLVKRRIKSSTLKAESLVLGRKTTTMINLLYFDDIAEKENLEKLKAEIEKIDIDGLCDSGTLAEYLELENNTHFPSVIRTERPDTVANALLEGKIAILVDTSPFALILPAFFSDFINPVADNYLKSKNVNFLKILRLSCFFLTMAVPGFYIAMVNYNPETIPTSLLINFGTQRADVPFPAIVEAIIMLIICEILKESDVRFPNSYGSAISILGALVLGEAAVSAGIVSPIMIIVIAFTFITSLLFTNQEIVGAIRHFRFIFLFTATLYGLFGVFLAFIYFFIHVSELTTLKKPYFYPFAPYDKVYIKKGVLKPQIDKDIRRSKMITQKNRIRQRRNTN